MKRIMYEMVFEKVIFLTSQQEEQKHLICYYFYVGSQSQKLIK